VRERMLALPHFVPVGNPAAARPLGVVSRMQLLRHLHGQLSSFEERIDHRSERQRSARPNTQRKPTQLRSWGRLRQQEWRKAATLQDISIDRRNARSSSEEPPR
jgi:hypothetical protein